MRVIVSATSVMVRVMVVVIVVPNVNSVAAVLVAPLNLCLKVWSFAVLMTLDGVVRVAPSVAELPSTWIRNTGVPVRIARAR